MHNCPKTLGEYGCGECLRARTYDKRVWSHRMDLECRSHAECCFLTLTYSDDFLPPDGSLSKRDCVLWFKRFRQELWRLYKIRVRYFIVGEYGDETKRPHYHAALFGVGLWAEDIARTTWKMGHVMLGDLNIASIRYVAGYIQKKMVVKNNDGLQPEFRLMSKGLGRGLASSIAETLDCAKGATTMYDTPVSLHLSGTLAPLGRYMRSKIKESRNGEISQSAFDRLSLYLQDEKEVRRLRAHFFSAPQTEAMTAAKFVDTIIRDREQLRLEQLAYKKYLKNTISQKMSFNDYRDALRKQKNLNSESSFKRSKKGSI